MEPEIPIFICESCVEDIGYFNSGINSLNLPIEVENYCDGIVCIGRYSDALKTSLRRLKFGNKPSYYRAFGKLLALKVQNSSDMPVIDIIIPVPLHRKKQKQRGYNQAELIGIFSAKILKLPHASKILIKATETKSQSLLSRKDRLSNVMDSFRVINEKGVVGKNILLVDDIVTTGSTINECCKALKKAGARQVIAGVIATTRE